MWPGTETREGRLRRVATEPCTQLNQSGIEPGSRAEGTETTSRQNTKEPKL